MSGEGARVSLGRRELLKRSGGALLGLGLLHLAGGYGQTHCRSIYLAPGHSPRPQSIEV